MPDEPKPPIQHLIRQQMAANQAKNLLYERAGQIMDIDPAFLAALEDQLILARANPAASLSSLDRIAFAARSLLDRLSAVNPYLSVSPGQIQELEAIYARTWQAILLSGQIQAVLRQVHYPALSRWLSEIYPLEFRRRLRYSPVVGQVVYAEYSARFQLDLFRLDLDNLPTPLLDIGCGSQAHLVRFLRQHGVEAFGFDRRLVENAPYLEQRDWFDHAFQSGRWGTILSNMAFSNHLQYAALHEPARLEPYLLTLRAILDSLAPGGQFLYAPALPWVEDNLSSNIRVERFPGPTALQVARLTRLQEPFSTIPPR